MTNMTKCKHQFLIYDQRKGIIFMICPLCEEQRLFTIANGSIAIWNKSTSTWELLKKKAIK